VALTVALWGVPLGEIGRALAAADPLLLAVPATLFFVQQLIRAWRQALLLRGTHPDHSYRTSLSVLCISFFFINILPARAGEVVRPLLLAERDGIPLGTGTAMVVLERALDLGAMCLMIAIAASTLPPEAAASLPLEALPLPEGVDESSVLGLLRAVAVVGVLSVAAGLLGLLFAGPLVVGGLSRLWSVERRPALRGRVLGFLASFVDALHAGRRPGQLLPVLALSALTWLVTVAMYPTLSAALGAPGLVDMGQGVGVLGFTMLGMALPAAPGFAGTYEAFARAGLALYGVAGDVRLAGPTSPTLDGLAIAFVLTIHWGTHLVQSATAVYFLAVDRIDPVRMAQRAWSGQLSAPASSGS
jgi:uncharacterized membrane protein YbhN (UPF0104 family)